MKKILKKSLLLAVSVVGMSLNAAPVDPTAAVCRAVEILRAEKEYYIGDYADVNGISRETVAEILRLSAKNKKAIEKLVASEVVLDDAEKNEVVANLQNLIRVHNTLEILYRTSVKPIVMEDDTVVAGGGCLYSTGRLGCPGGFARENLQKIFIGDGDRGRLKEGSLKGELVYAVEFMCGGQTCQLFFLDDSKGRDLRGDVALVDGFRIKDGQAGVFQTPRAHYLATGDPRAGEFFAINMAEVLLLRC